MSMFFSSLFAFPSLSLFCSFLLSLFLLFASTSPATFSLSFFSLPQPRQPPSLSIFSLFLLSFLSSLCLNLVGQVWWCSRVSDLDFDPGEVWWCHRCVNVAWVVSLWPAQRGALDLGVRRELIRVLGLGADDFDEDDGGGDVVGVWGRTLMRQRERRKTESRKWFPVTSRSLNLQLRPRFSGRGNFFKVGKLLSSRRTTTWDLLLDARLEELLSAGSCRSSLGNL